jgi:hypothetical protein
VKETGLNQAVALYKTGVPGSKGAVLEYFLGALDGVLRFDLVNIYKDYFKSNEVFSADMLDALKHASEIGNLSLATSEPDFVLDAIKLYCDEQGIKLSTCTATEVFYNDQREICRGPNGSYVAADSNKADFASNLIENNPDSRVIGAGDNADDIGFAEVITKHGGTFVWVLDNMKRNTEGKIADQKVREKTAQEHNELKTRQEFTQFLLSLAGNAIAGNQQINLPK